MKLRLTPIAAATMALLGTCAHAQEAAGEKDAADAAKQSATQLAPVVVQEEVESGYARRETATATKTDTPLREVPQSITVVTDAQIKDQGAQGIADVVRYVPGVGTHQGENNRDQVIFRGTSSSSDFYINGVKDDVQYYRDLYNTERVEVLKGPDGMIFGRGGGGGVLNRVLREADWQQVRELTLQLGSYSDGRATVDVGQGFGDFAGRLTGMYEKSDGFRDGYELERYGINPTFGIRAGDNTRIVLGYEKFHDDRTADRGIPSLNGRPLDTDRSTFFGDPNQSLAKADVDSFSAEIESQLGQNVSLRNSTRYGRYDRMYQNYVPGAVNATAQTVPLTAYNNHGTRDNLFNQTDLVWKLSTGSLHHTVLTGVELGRQESENERQTGYFPVSANTNAAGTTYNAPLSNPQINVPMDWHSNGTTDAINTGTTTVAAAYVQDQLQITSKFQTVLGVRVDEFKVDFNDKRPAPSGAGKIKTTDTLVSPRVGLIYEPTDDLAAYASYTVSYVPRAGEQLSSLTVINSDLDPEQYRNIEIGLKWDVSSDFAFTAAAYKQRRDNVAVADPAAGTPGGPPAGSLMLVDGQLVVGLELGVTGHLTRKWSIAGGYSYQLGEISSNQSATVLKGALLAQVPTDTLSLWNRYDFTPAWGVGLGVISRSAMFAATENTATPAANVTLAGYARVDAALYWTISKSLSAQLNVENVLDKEYFVNADNNNNISFGGPRAVRANVTARF